MTTRQKNMLIVTVITSFIAPFMSSALNLSISDISSQFSCGATTVTWVVNAYTLATAIFSVPFGHRADIHGRRGMLLLGTAVFALCSLGAIFAMNVYFLILVRVGMGIGAAIFLAANVPLLLTYFEPREKGRMLGLTVTAVYAGLSLGPVLGGAINTLLGWRWIFVLGIVLSLLAYLLTWIRIEDDADAVCDTSGDPMGNVLFMCSIALLMFGLSEWSHYPWAPVLVVASIPLFIAFVRHELHTEVPVVQVRLFKHSLAYSLSNLAALLSFGATYAVIYVMALYLQDVQGFSSAIAGVILISQPVIQTLLSPLAGRLSDRIASYKLASAGLFLVAIGLFILSFVRVGLPLWCTIAGLVIIGLGNALFSSPNINAVLSCVDRAHYSEANSTLSTMRGIGQSISLVIVSLVFGFVIDDAVFSTTDPTQLAYAIHLVLIICSIICVGAMAISMVRGKERD